MDANELNPQPFSNPYQSPQLTLIDAIPEFAIDYPPPPPPVRRIWLPLLLFIITCVSTFVAGTGIIFSDHLPKVWWPAIVDGLMYSAAVMTILLCHEMGHFVQAWRYGVYASLPYFIPFPLTPIGTFGAVIRLDPQRGDRKAIFDIGISGPLAGLVPTLIFLVLGLSWSTWVPVPVFPNGQGEHFVLGEPLLMRYFTYLLKGPIPPGQDLMWHPIAFAGWVGLLITSINLIPIGQLDGGHILYGMFLRKAHVASMALLVLAITLSVWLKLTNWWLMLGLITILGTRHPPTANDYAPLGTGRYVLGILTLAFLFLGFTPTPIGVGH